MTTIQKFPDSEFPTIFCTKLIVKPTTTLLKWSTSKKHPEVIILGAIDTSKTNSAAGERGLLGAQGFVIGTSVRNWFYDVLVTETIYVGMADINKDFTTAAGAQVSRLLSVTEGDKIRFSLTAGSTLTLRHETGTGTVLNIFVHDLSAFTGQTLYTWLSTTVGGTMSVKLMEDFNFTITVDPDGKVRMNGTNNDIVDFNLDDIIDNGGDTIINNTSNSSIEIDDAGDINLNGGISFKCDNITDPLTCVELKTDQFAVIISNPVSTAVLLPPAGANGCQYFSVIRNYPLQVGETWQNPVLRVVATSGDMIEDMPWCGLPPESNLQVMSDGITSWRIM